jgi:fluoroacetyl-CoA thioesterase
MTVGHFVAQMPQVYAAPMMIPHTEMAAGSAIASRLPAMAPIAAASSM